MLVALGKGLVHERCVRVEVESAKLAIVNAELALKQTKYNLGRLIQLVEVTGASALPPNSRDGKVFTAEANSALD